nr:hypothetical protein [Candidatus Sigynarchaeota archaeon]
MPIGKGFPPRKKERAESNPANARVKHSGTYIECAALKEQVGVVVEQTRGMTLYTIDMLRHEGIFHDAFTFQAFFKLTKWPRLIILIGPAKLDARQASRIKDHVKAGNGLIVVGMIEALEDVLGIMYKIPVFSFPVGGIRDNSIGEGYLQLKDESFAKQYPSTWFPLHGFGCAPVLVDGASVIADYETVHESGERWAAITSIEVASGVAIQIGIELAKTIRHVQEGRYVDKDGIPPPDGMAPIDDGILKCEDGLVLDWTRDRRAVSPSSHVPAFTIPVADAWRKLFVACIEQIADKCKIPLKRCWYWPTGAEFVTLLSHDSDGNSEEMASHLLAEIGKAGIKTTWCLEAPGYSPGTCAKILQAGHELALHFDAIAYPGGKQHDEIGMAALFSREMLERQLNGVIDHSGYHDIYSNKNHYTRWSGRVQFFEWCEQLGIRVDQSKGPSKCGTFGFPFGTCHPWQAMNGAGELIGCLEIGFQSQDFGLQGPPDTIDDLLVAVKQANGVAHVIFHPAHSKRPDVNKAMHEFINKARQMGAIFLTSKEIGEWTFERKHMVAAGLVTLKDAVIQVRERSTWLNLPGPSPLLGSEQ